MEQQQAQQWPQQQPPQRAPAPNLMSATLPVSAVSLLGKSGRLRSGSSLWSFNFSNATDFLEQVGNATQINPVESAATSLIWLVFLSIIAFFYYDHKPHPPVQKHDRAYGVTMGEWRYGLFHCFDQPSLCLFACCCGAIRWADTQRMGNYMGYWQGFLMYAVLQQLSPMPYVGMGAGLLWTILVTYQRQKIRKRFQIPYFDCYNCTGS